MKRILVLSSIAVFLFAFKPSPNSNPFKNVVNKSFTDKELLEYKVSYGIISAGEAKVEISPEIHSINGRACYKIDVTGKTTGAFDMVAKINDVWGSYIDTASIVPHISYRKLSEGGYKKYEVVRFDHKTSFLEAKTWNYKMKEYREPKYYMFPEDAQDLVSGFYYLRSLDFDTIAINDTISMNAFFEDKVYDFKILYLGKETVKTDFGKIPALVLKPLMPDNKIFAGENSITCYLSDDENKIPLEIKTNLFIGTARVELKRAENLKSPLKVIEK